MMNRESKYVDKLLKELENSVESGYSANKRTLIVDSANWSTGNNNYVVELYDGLYILYVNNTNLPIGQRQIKRLLNYFQKRLDKQTKNNINAVL